LAKRGGYSITSSRDAGSGQIVAHVAETKKHLQQALEAQEQIAEFVTGGSTRRKRRR